LPEVPCADVSAALDEPAWATASVVHSWLLVEQPGAWGHDAVTESGLPADVAHELATRAAAHHVRILLIRQLPRPRRGPRRCFAVSSRRPDPWIEAGAFDGPEDLLDVDLAALAAGQSPGVGQRADRPLYTVCTNGKHDPCCARLGRPVARSLVRACPGAVWECSHLGGDRFAANLVCFPHGLYYGRVEPADARRVAEAYERGAVELDHWRGRAGDAFVVQAAERFLRLELGVVGVDDVVPLRRRRPAGHEPGLVDVDFGAPGDQRYTVRVRAGGDPVPRLLSCGAARPERPPAFELVAVNPGGASGLAVH
jgi:hypothetical protein